MILVANPGSASRKYALFDKTQMRAEIHFELKDGKVVCSLNHQQIPIKSNSLEEAAGQVSDILHKQGYMRDKDNIVRVGLRLVAPSGYFLSDRVIDDQAITKLKVLQARAPLHIKATLNELKLIKHTMPKALIVGVSDSAFHITKPDYAWNYGLPLADADRLELKRFGYHGLSVEGVAETLRRSEKLLPKVIVVHLGSGASVTALRNGKSLDNTMGYSPLEGVIMATRSGSIDPTVAYAIKDSLELTDLELEDYLNTRSGLLGLGQSSDIRTLLERKSNGDTIASLALDTFCYSVVKSIGQMTAVLAGVDALVFTGTVGERSAAVRKSIVRQLQFLGFALEEKANLACTDPKDLTVISNLSGHKPLFVVPTNEAQIIARHTMQYKPKSQNSN